MSRNQIHPEYASVEVEDGVTFSKGNMLVDGMAQIPRQVQDWESSNGLSHYTAVMWEHPTTGEMRCSCNCPGWAIKRKGTPRQCEHVKDMMGLMTCKKTRIDQRPVRITTVSQAEERINKFDGKELRGIDL